MPARQTSPSLQNNEADVRSAGGMEIRFTFSLQHQQHVCKGRRYFGEQGGRQFNALMALQPPSAALEITESCTQFHVYAKGKG